MFFGQRFNDATCVDLLGCFSGVSVLMEDSKCCARVLENEKQKQKNQNLFFGLPLSLKIASQVVDGRAW
tara:strand:- start:274 stop:480 length:207 start_codon:yes stop_codon:yes gene_type:complete